MTNEQRDNIYELARLLDLIILVDGIEYKFSNGKLYKL